MSEKKKFVFSAPFVYSLHLIVASNLLPYYHYKLTLFIPLFLFLYLFKIPKKQVLISFFISSVFLVLLYFLRPYRIKGTYLSSIFNYLFPLNKAIVGWVSSSYPKDVAEMINVVLFNSKSADSYSDFVTLGIPYLIAVSGMHISLLRKVLSKLINIRKLVIFLLFIYWYAIDFSIPALRVFLLMILPASDDDIKQWGVISLCSLLFNIHILSSLSFLLSYGLSLIFSFNKRFFQEPYLRYFFNFIFAFFLSTIAFLPFRPHRIFPLSILNACIFSPIIVFLFLYFFLFWYCKFLTPVHSFIVSSFNSFHNQLSVNKLFIVIDYWNYEYSILCLVLFCTFVIIFLYVWYCYFTPKTRDY